MAVLPLRELCDSGGVAEASLTPEDGTQSRSWYCDVKDFTIIPQDVLDTELDFLGTTDTGLHGGMLNRILPTADPHRPGWVVRSVKSKGFGYTDGKGGKSPAYQLITPVGAPAGSLATLPQPPREFWMYPNWRFDVTYGPRPYPMVSDAAIVKQTTDPTTNAALSWKLAAGGTSAPNFTSYYPEWWRYTVVTPEAQNDYITTNQGQMILWGIPNKADGVVATGMPRMFLPNDLITVNWFCVPRRYVTSPNSYLSGLRGLINQYAWFESDTDRTKLLYQPGSLLYLTYTFTEFTPTQQTLVLWNKDIVSLPKLVNLKLTFLRTRRITSTPANVLAGITNPNYVATAGQGHNQLPWLGSVDQATQGPLPGGRLFYYTTMGGIAGPPSFISAPVPHLLFQDPDAPGAPQVPNQF